MLTKKQLEEKREDIIHALEVGEHISFKYKGHIYDYEPMVYGDCLFDDPYAKDPIAMCEPDKAITDLYFDGKLLVDILMESEFI